MRDLESPGRSPVRACNAMVSTSNPLASQAALSVLHEGGNAVDAAIAAMAVLCVVETLNVTIGGDCFALVALGGRTPVLAYNGSGRAPAEADTTPARAHGWTSLPSTSPDAVTIPGVVEAWDRLAKAHGTHGLDRLLRPAIHYAEHGYPVHDVIARQWARATARLHADTQARQLFLWDDRPPAPGQVHRQPELARTLRKIATHGASAFYRGGIAARIVAHLRSLGGSHREDDFERHAGEFVGPVAIGYRGHLVHECPPNGQGVAALMILGLLDRFAPAEDDPLGTARLHHAIEAGRLAIAARDNLVGDPSSRGWEGMLTPAALDRAAGLIDPYQCMAPRALPSPRMGTDTCHVAVVDRDGTAVSMIASVFEDFGSGIVPPGTGVLLQNRGCGFSLVPGHPNEYGPGRRPLHTIIPAMVSRDGRITHVLGVVGGHYQAWGQAHVLANQLDFGCDAQRALDLPRLWHDGTKVEAERGIPEGTIAGLRRLGHEVAWHRDMEDPWPLGGGQLIVVDSASGSLTGAADPRLDGCALGF
jgi:gamma-glutamyltranspeptidase/glutathione hydrolase